MRKRVSLSSRLYRPLVLHWTVCTACGTWFLLERVWKLVHGPLHEGVCQDCAPTREEALKVLGYEEFRR